MDQVLSPNRDPTPNRQLFRVLSIVRTGPDGIVTVGDILTTHPDTYSSKRGYRSLAIKRSGGIPFIWEATRADLETLKRHEITRTLHRRLCEEHHKGLCGPHPLQQWVFNIEPELSAWLLKFSGSLILGAAATAKVLREWRAVSPGTFDRFMNGEDYF